MATIRNRVVRASLPVTTLSIHICSPPAKPFHPAWVYEPEEDNNNAECQTRIQRRAEGHSVFGPPCRCPVLDQVIEDITYHSPDREVEPGRWRDPTKRPEEDGQVNLANDAGLFIAAVQPQWDRGDGSDKKTPHQRAVSCIWSEKLGRPNDAPEDGSVEVDSGDRTGKAVDGRGRADSRYVKEHPVEDKDLRD